ncbi:MAG: hypothetical protein LBK97_01990 [Prevotellaceae bacterium]|jgi:hypothetical protein|nr:hypothetical protein [Prevotellaceae bacterium]
MYKNSFFRKASLISAIVTIAVIASVMSGCQKEEDEPLDENILNSVELEEYIIAGADFQKSLVTFSKKLNKIDFSKLEVSYDAEGRKVKRLPLAPFASIGIDEKVQTFNERKDALLGKFPQFASFREDLEIKYFQQCIQNSVNVKGRFLKLGINTSRPLLKSGSEQEWSGEEWNFLNQYLASWMNSSNYVEMAIIAFADGTYMTYVDSQNDANHAYISISTYANGNYYFIGNQSSPMIWFAHTHQNSSSPGAADNNFKNKYPNMGHYIYYQGGFYSWE